VCKEADRFAVREVDGDLDVGFLLRSVEDAGGLVAGENWGLGAVGPGEDVASAIAHLFALSVHSSRLLVDVILAPCTALKRGEELR
jgi:hypothetical protein